MLKKNKSKRGGVHSKKITFRKRYSKRYNFVF